MKKDFVFIPCDKNYPQLGLKVLANEYNEGTERQYQFFLSSTIGGKAPHLWMKPDEMRTLAKGLNDAADKLEAGTLFEEEKHEEPPLINLFVSDLGKPEIVVVNGVVYDRRKG